MSATNGRLTPLIEPDRASSNSSASRPVAFFSSIQLIRGTAVSPLLLVAGRLTAGGHFDFDPHPGIGQSRGNHRRGGTHVAEILPGGPPRLVELRRVRH